MWLTQTGNSRIRVADCGGALCGTIIWLKEPNDPDTGKPKTDKNNSDASKRSRPLIGVQIVLGMKPAGADKWTGPGLQRRGRQDLFGQSHVPGRQLAAAAGLRARRPRLQETDLDQGQLISLRPATRNDPWSRA